MNTGKCPNCGYKVRVFVTGMVKCQQCGMVFYVDRRRDASTEDKREEGGNGGVSGEGKE